MAERFGLPAALFAVKCFIAGMLALYVSLRIGLPRPYWAVATSFIIAQPLAGAVLSKALFRVIGTAVGAAAAIVMVPNLANAPVLLSLAFAGWLALCVFVSTLERTPRAYIFVLAGYSACIIGLPSVGTPGAIFDVAILRVQEIVIGILCGSLIHGLVFPGSVTELLLGRVDATLRDAETWSSDAIGGEAVPGLDAERRRLSLDITEMHQLSVHLPFETARAAPRVRTVRALQDQLSLILPLTVAVEDRLKALAAAGVALPAAVAALIADCRAWLAQPGDDRAARDAAAEELRTRAAALEPETRAGMGWNAALMLSLLARLSALIEAHRDCRDLRDQMASHGRRPVSLRVAALMEGRSRRELHRDYGAALRGAFAAAISILIGCALWIASGWQDAGTGVMLAGVYLALFAAADDPMAPLRAFFIGTTVALVLGGFYAFVILPRVDGFPMLAAVLAPGLLLGGSVMASPRHYLVAVSAMMGLASPSILSAQFTSDFAAYVNSSIAQILGMMLAVTIARLMQSAGLDGAVNRTLKAGWADIASRANLAAPPNVQLWVSRMLDRIGLLVPRLAARGEDPGKPLYDALRDLRTGMVIGELRQLRVDLPTREGRAITPVLADIAAYYARMDPARENLPTPVMLGRIDRAIARLVRNPSQEARRAAVLALVSLRRNLFPEAAPYREMRA